MSRGTRSTAIRAGVPLVCVLLAAVAGRAAWSTGQARPELPLQDVAAVSGFTKMATTAHYIVVVNVLPAEEMFTAEAVAKEHPTEGEVVLRGSGTPVLPSGRHVEAHVYDRSTGLPTTAETPTIALEDGETGARTTIEPTLMQDVVIGAPDVHFGNNAVVRGNRDVTVTVTVAGEEVVVSGHLD